MFGKWLDSDTMTPNIYKMAKKFGKSPSFCSFHYINIYIVKLREREGQRVDLGRSLKGQRYFIDGGWWMVDILSLMLYIKFGCHPPTHPPQVS